MLAITIEDDDRGRWAVLGPPDPTRVLVVLAGAGFDAERLRGEARRADYVVAADAGAALCVAAGLALEAVVGDFDSLDPVTRAKLQLGGRGLSNRVVSPEATLIVHEGVALVWIEA